MQFLLYCCSFLFLSLIAQAHSSACLPKTKILRYLLEGTAASTVEGIGDDERDAVEVSKHVVSPSKCHFVYQVSLVVLLENMLTLMNTSLENYLKP